ncbi:MAG TPA: non-reducing end alpha-L-arabinofuranosidase family hydrolase [Kineosporiaceae bacterium]|nr:non-reducing end alpha-L-arabinofuranosidase family hydrolase [Kineosporiaceae bacterium]
MSTEPQDEGWAAHRLSAEAHVFRFDRAAFLARVMSDVQAWDAAEAPEADPYGGRSVARLRPVPGFGTRRAVTTVRREPRPRFAPAFLAAAAIVAIAVGGSLVPGLHLWESGEQSGTARAANRPPTVNTAPLAPSETPATAQANPPAPTPTPTVPTASAPTSSAPTVALPSHFRWTSGAPLVSVKPDDGHAVTGIKDASVVYYQGKWHVFATATGASAATLVYLNFTDWAEAGSAPQYFLDTSALGSGYRAAPQVFYFAPQKLWYLIYQSDGGASYSTNPDISNPGGWSAPKDFYPGGMPDLIRQNVGNRYWVDMWVICDDTDCYLFSSDQQGHLYRARTGLADFPNGMSQPVVALEDPNRSNLLNSTSVYKVAGLDRYLLIVEAVGPDRRSYQRSWTADRLDGLWTPLAATESNPFAGLANVTFGGNVWAEGISHGELLRSGHDQTLTVDPCGLRFVYHSQSRQLGLLTQTNSACS